MPTALVSAATPHPPAKAGGYRNAAASRLRISVWPTSSPRRTTFRITGSPLPSDTVKVAKFVEAAVLPVLKKAQADQSSRDRARQPQAANIERAGAVLTSSPSPEFEVGVSARLEGINNPTVVNVTSSAFRSGFDYTHRTRPRGRIEPRFLRRNHSAIRPDGAR